MKNRTIRARQEEKKKISRGKQEEREKISKEVDQEKKKNNIRTKTKNSNKKEKSKDKKNKQEEEKKVAEGQKKGLSVICPPCTRLAFFLRRGSSKRSLKFAPFLEVFVVIHPNIYFCSVLRDFVWVIFEAENRNLIVSNLTTWLSVFCPHHFG